MKFEKKTWKILWLLGFIVLTLSMISIGGITRLTRSGLSMVEWKPVSGIIPPLSEQEWQQQFDLYKVSPEYQQVNSHFELTDYKRIFMWEYLHRLLGRIIFLFVLIPGLILWSKKIVPGKIVGILAALIASQGLIGWLMVKSGLNNEPHVSPFMLALHFFSALAVLLTGQYFLCQEYSPIVAPLSRWQKRLLNGFGAVLCLQIFYGCLTSGIKAGFVFNTYPLMGGQFFPSSGFDLPGYWSNFFENPGLVQWVHRWIGALTLIYLAIISLILTKTSAWRYMQASLLQLMGITAIQILLGILNIVFRVPTWLGALHQLVAAVLILSFFNIIFRLKHRALS